MRHRPRRLRRTAAIRNLVRETRLHVSELIYPLFIVEGHQIKKEMPTLPGVYQLSIDQLAKEVQELQALNIEHVLLFGVLEADEKDAHGSAAYQPEGLVQRAIRAIKMQALDMNVITDVCLCEYTSHGHCGVLTDEQAIDNDASLEILAKIAVSHARAGADIIAPSDMMDGRIGHLRQALDASGYAEIAMMSYSVKYASNFYGPFREAAKCAPSSGDRKTYQMDYANGAESLKEAQLDIDEGADFLMVKPALSYLDIIYRVKEKTAMPLVAYHTSGEYAMLKMAIKEGILAEDAMMETIISIKRAGADRIITYLAKELARKLQT
ncbi:MAG: porphobilinogen synthase [Defluviitaleaceae bacterium]|nr:porphobilinogen synthase [Defluviitaleaceae bacterium]